MQRPALDGVVETCLYVEDVGRSRAFYQRVFGFAAMGGDDRICPLAVAPGQVLILFARGATLEPLHIKGGTIPPHDASGEQHFALSMGVDAVEHWKSYLEALHIEIEGEVDWPQGGHSLYFRDPDRLLVELITPGVWPKC
jgi:catechol 2,3-dioxygenase-like lactoylglutathione lyase family enzyme